MASYPRLLPVRQRLYSNPLADIPASVRAAVDGAVPSGKLRPGMRVALTAGSRGINNIAVILKAAVDALRDHACEPFIIPAMGSHGGATAEGQLALLRDTFGISPESMGCPV